MVQFNILSEILEATLSGSPKSNPQIRPRRTSGVLIILCRRVRYHQGAKFVHPNTALAYQYNCNTINL